VDVSPEEVAVAYVSSGVKWRSSIQKRGCLDRALPRLRQAYSREVRRDLPTGTAPAPGPASVNHNVQALVLP
jgi:hypothetical protein